jgi:hypothetical protein
MANHSDARLNRLFGPNAVGMNPVELRAAIGMSPVAKSMVREAIVGYETRIAALLEQMDDYQEVRDRLRLTQLALIVALQKMGGSMEMYAGQMNEIPKGSVVRVEKLERGDGDNVPLRVSWHPPDPNRPATTDYRPGS